GAQVVGDRLQVVPQPPREIGDDIGQGPLLLLCDLLGAAVEGDGGRRDHAHQEQPPHRTPPRRSRLARNVSNACDTPSVNPAAAFAGFWTASDTARTAESTLSVASTALSVMCPTFSSSSFTWSSDVDTLPSIGTTSATTPSRAVLMRWSVPDRRRSTITSPIAVRMRKTARAYCHASDAVASRISWTATPASYSIVPAPTTASPS